MRFRLTHLVGLALGLAAAGCSAGIRTPAVPRVLHADTALGPGASNISLLIEPDAGVRPVVRAIDRAQQRILLECYILTDSLIVRALERAQAQGVSVDVMLERHPLGMGSQPERMANTLRAAGVAVRWGRPGFQLTHAKFLILDDRIAVVSTANLSRAAFAHNREFLIFDRRSVEVRALSNLFRLDWDRTAGLVRAPDLLIAPDNARVKLQTLLRRARHTVLVYAEEAADRGLESLLGTLTARGVHVRVLLAWGATPAGAAALAHGGVRVRELRQPYIHAKMMLVDGREGFVGSENVSAASLDRNREVGILVRGPVLASLGRVFSRDWDAATPIPPARRTR